MHIPYICVIVRIPEICVIVHECSCVCVCARACANSKGDNKHMKEIRWSGIHSGIMNGEDYVLRN